MRAEAIDREAIRRSKTFWGWGLWVFGFGVVVPPLTGLAGTVMGMIRAFGTLQEEGAADPSALAGDISVALLTTFWGIVFSFFSLVPFVVSLVLFLRRRRLLRDLDVVSHGNDPDAPEVVAAKRGETGF